MPELDGLRGLAIGMVMLHHFWPRHGTLARWQSLPHLGWVGVDLFFVISGFLITGILLDSQGEEGYFRSFYARRALRIFPLYYLILIVVFCLLPLMQHGHYFDTPFVRQSGSPAWYFLYCANIREAIAGHGPAYVLAPLWSLSIEEQFYICYPIIVFLLGKRRLPWFLIGVVIFAAVFRIATMLIWPDRERIQYIATFARVDVIALGALIAVSLRTERWQLKRPVVLDALLLMATSACAIAFVLTGLNRTETFCRSIGYSLIDVTFALFVFWTVRNRGKDSTAWLRFAPLRKLGIVCYGAYLLQGPAELLLAKFMTLAALPFDLDSGLGLVCKCATAIALAIVSWYIFEKPILAFKRYFELRGRPRGLLLAKR